MKKALNERRLCELAGVLAEADTEKMGAVTPSSAMPTHKLSAVEFEKELQKAKEQESLTKKDFDRLWRQYSALRRGPGTEPFIRVADPEPRDDPEEQTQRELALALTGKLEPAVLSQLEKQDILSGDEIVHSWQIWKANAQPESDPTTGFVKTPSQLLQSKQIGREVADYFFTAPGALEVLRSATAIVKDLHEEELFWNQISARGSTPQEKEESNRRAQEGLADLAAQEETEEYQDAYEIYKIWETLLAGVPPVVSAALKLRNRGEWDIVGDDEIRGALFKVVSQLGGSEEEKRQAMRTGKLGKLYAPWAKYTF